MIKFENVSLKLKERVVLSNVSFEIEDKSVVCFIANRTKSKAYILKIIAGIYKNYDGNVFIDGKNIKDNIDTKISMIFDVDEKDDNMTVYEYLKFYANLSEIKTDQCEEYINSSLKNLEIMSYKYTLMSDLNKNLLKLVGIIRAMIKDPNILLIDGLFSGTDINFNYMLLNYIKKLVENKTIIFDNTKIEYIEDICTDIGVLIDDNLLVYGKKDDVYKKASLNKKIEIVVNGDVMPAINLLKQYDGITNIMYDDKMITFAIISSEFSQDEVLKKLIDNNIKIYSYKNENLTKEQLIEGLGQNK